MTEYETQYELRNICSAIYNPEHYTENAKL